MEDSSKTKWESNESTARALGCYKSLLLHIPPSSIAFPVHSNHSFNDLDDEEKLLIDYFTDKLFIPDEKVDNVENLVYPYCRLYCDVERLMKDPLEREGLGISYNRVVSSGSEDSCTFHSFSTRNEAFHQYVDFHASAIKRLFEMGDNTLLLDCHSFSNLPNLLNPTPKDIDICIGYNDDETCPEKWLVGRIVQHFESLGYIVGINEPFSNSKTFDVPVVYHSIMIEINKRLYMNEETLEKKESFMSVHQHLMSMYRILLKND